MKAKGDQTRDTPLQVWGGVECTIARDGGRFRDQTFETGHHLRLNDIDLIAGLGFKQVRYPILWETVAPDRPDELDFSWSDERLNALRDRGVGIVAGLVHHGSGPGYTSLLDPKFPEKLGAYAARVAERYPWIGLWTPVNEPLTTARFAGLYGHWYPHRRDYRSFLRALVNQCLGTRAAMQAIRAVNPEAGLLHTEDLGKTFSTAPLRYQAAHENERRWLSSDLLAGRVDRSHPWHRILLRHGISEAELEMLAAGQAVPDLLGINHYLTSERFLDHRIDRYPGMETGGNKRDRYVDGEAVRVRRLQSLTGIGPRLNEAWERYRIPLVVSEVHHGCTRDEQLRWFAEVWGTSNRLREEGIDLRAVTLWSLFGNVDWRSLLTRREGVYDVGAFDVRGPAPRPTVIAAAARSFAQGKPFDHAVLDAPGWWHRPARLYPWHGRCRTLRTGGRKLLITGATGTLGRAFARICEHRGLPYCLTGRGELDLSDERSIENALDRFQPWAVVNTAGFVRVADAERERDACLSVNAAGAERLALACASAKCRLVTFSSDLVFDGRKGAPYLESDKAAPRNVYGFSKAEAERRVLAAAEDALMVRTSAFFGPWDKHNFAWHVLSALARGDPVQAEPNIFVSPTYVPDLCHAALDLLIDGEAGIWHLANQGRLSWYEFAARLAEGAGYDPALIRRGNGAAADTSLASEHGAMLRPIDHAIDAFLAETRELHSLESRIQIAAE